VTNRSIKEEITERIKKCRKSVSVRGTYFRNIKCLRRGKYAYLKVTTCPY
jgi:hypothetical protein